MSWEKPTGPDPWGGDDDQWAPKDGDEGAEVEGEVKELVTAYSKKFDREFVVIVATDGTRIPCARAHLSSLVEEANLEPGDRFWIKFFGREAEGEPYLYALRKQEAGVPF